MPKTHKPSSTVVATKEEQPLSFSATLTPHELAFLRAYRSHPEKQAQVDKILNTSKNLTDGDVKTAYPADS